MISYQQQTLDDRWDAIVIGSGIGGLTAAALLSKYASRKVLVLERHYTAGGYTHSFRRPGYSWDVGVHYVGDCKIPPRLCAPPSTTSPTGSLNGRLCPTFTTAS
jgi:all-trans-retinol 13,14-reductase